MKATELRNMSDQELDGQLTEKKTELFNLRFQHAAGQLENANRLVFVKKDIARILTIITERQYGISMQVEKTKTEKPKKEKEVKVKKAKAEEVKKETKSKVKKTETEDKAAK